MFIFIVLYGCCFFCSNESMSLILFYYGFVFDGFGLEGVFVSVEGKTDVVLV